MPFPLAHPAAVLPFRRFSPRHLNFMALVIGAITPDVSYCLERYDVDRFAHSIRGCFGFSLPVGWVLLLIFYAVREPLVNLLPAPHRQALLPVCWKSSQRWFAVPLSLLIGAATHVLWDSFTHETGWFVERSSLLQLSLLTWHEHSFRLYRLLWHISTWGGLFLLYWAYAEALKRRTGSAEVFAAVERRRYALWMGLLLLPLVGVVPIALVRCPSSVSLAVLVPRFLRLSAALYLVVLSVLLTVIGATLKRKRR